MENLSNISCSADAGKRKNSSISDTVDHKTPQENEYHPVSNDVRLLNAIESESACAVVALLTAENTFTQEGLNQALISACRRGRKQLVQTLVRAGANIEHRDKHGNTPLLICAENGFTDIVQFLVSKHANIKAVNSVGNTALILSVRPAGSTDLTRFLLEQQDVDIHHENQHGQTALIRATQFMDVDTMRLLLQKSMRRNTPEIFRKGFLIKQEPQWTFFKSRAQETKQQVTAAENGLGIVNESLKKHLITGTSPLELAIKAGDTKSLDMFLDCQIPFNQEKKKHIDGALAYMFDECRHKSVRKFSSTDVKLIETLLQNGADVNLDFKPKLIALAVESGNVQLIETMCTHGVDMKACYSKEEDPLCIAAKNGRQDLVELLLTFQARVNRTDFCYSSLDCALRNIHIECAKLLIERGAKMDIRFALRSAIDSQMSGYMCFFCTRITNVKFGVIF